MDGFSHRTKSLSICQWTKRKRGYARKSENTSLKTERVGLLFLPRDLNWTQLAGLPFNLPSSDCPLPLQLLQKDGQQVHGSSQATILYCPSSESLNTLTIGILKNIPYSLSVIGLCETNRINNGKMIVDWEYGLSFKMPIVSVLSDSDEGQ